MVLVDDKHVHNYCCCDTEMFKIKLSLIHADEFGVLSYEIWLSSKPKSNH